jgi:hypothetical protein
MGPWNLYLRTSWTIGRPRIRNAIDLAGQNVQSDGKKGRNSAPRAKVVKVKDGGYTRMVYRGGMCLTYVPRITNAAARGASLSQGRHDGKQPEEAESERTTIGRTSLQVLPNTDERMYV